MTAPADRRRILTLLGTVLINAAVPVLVYVLVRPHVPGDLVALVIGAAIPTAYTATVLVWRRRLDPVGVIALGCFCVGLVLAVATGGDELIFKLREDLWTGPLGLACLVSVALRRPLFVTALRLAARRDTAIAERLRDPVAHRIAAVTTAVVGVVLLVHAVALVVLAQATTTTTFLATSRPISWSIIAAGLAPLVVWIRRQRPASAQRTTPPAPPPDSGRRPDHAPGAVPTGPGAPGNDDRPAPSNPSDQETV